MFFSSLLKDILLNITEYINSIYRIIDSCFFINTKLFHLTLVLLVWFQVKSLQLFLSLFLLCKVFFPVASVKISSLPLVYLSLNMMFLGLVCLFVWLICWFVLVFMFSVWCLWLILESSESLVLQIYFSSLFLLSSSSGILIIRILHLLELSHCSWMLCSVFLFIIFLSDFKFGKFLLTYLWSYWFFLWKFQSHSLFLSECFWFPTFIFYPLLEFPFHSFILSTFSFREIHT